MSANGETSRRHSYICDYVVFGQSLSLLSFLSGIYIYNYIESRQSNLQNFVYRHVSLVYKGFDLLLSGRAQHIGVSPFFVWIYIESRQSTLQKFFIGIYPSFIKGLSFCYLVEHSILFYRYFLSGYSLSLGSLFSRIFLSVFSPRL